jgi:hypothetical protein
MTQSLSIRLLIGLVLGTSLGFAHDASAESRATATEATPSELARQAEQDGEGDDEAAPAPRLHPAHSARAVSPAKRGKRGANAASKSKQPVAAEGSKQPSPEYCRLRDDWHAPIQPEPILDEHGRPPLVLAPVNEQGQVTIYPQHDRGGFSSADLIKASRVFTPQGVRGGPHPIAPHLVDLVYRAMRHFNASLVHLISGFRRDRAGSRHSQGRAIDMVLPGVSNEELAEYLRQFGFVGVGIYPKSGFVHLDVRDASFFWVDNSLPDERSRCEQILGEQAAAADDEARRRGQAPETFVPGNDREDRAATRAYKKRALRRQASAEQPKAL